MENQSSRACAGGCIQRTGRTGACRSQPAASCCCNRGAARNRRRHALKPRCLSPRFVLRRSSEQRESCHVVASFLSGQGKCARRGARTHARKSDGWLTSAVLRHGSCLTAPLKGRAGTGDVRKKHGKADREIAQVLRFYLAAARRAHRSHERLVGSRASNRRTRRSPRARTASPAVLRLVPRE